MMKTIIVPTDFSDNAMYAANYAADFALMLGAQLHLLHVYTIPAQVTEVPIAYDIAQIEKDNNDELNSIKKKLLARTNNQVSVHTVLRSGLVMTEISDYCELVKPYAVVMGAESADRFERMLGGGKTFAAIRRLPWPLIIVPPLTSYHNIRKICFACDFRVVVESVRIKEIRDLVKAFNAELHIIYITNTKGASFDDVTIEESALLQEMLGDLKPNYHFLNEPDVETAINQYAEKNKMDLLIIVPKKHNLVERIFHPTHSKKVAGNAHVPILSLHE
jgi:nucleotide-binding universal stress UspA family protein